MKVAIDTSPLESGHKHRGMGVYTRTLIMALGKLAKMNNDFTLDSFIFAQNKSRLGSYDVIHYPYFDLFYSSIPSNFSTKSVVTVGDVTPLLYPKHYPPGVKGKLRFLIQKKRLNSAKAVITFSETSKKDIVRLLNINPEKIHPIHLAPQLTSHKKITSELISFVKNKYKIPKTFVLYVGDVNYNKNLITLVKACKLVKIPLVIIGKQAASTDYDKNHIENRDLKTLQDKYGNDKDIIRTGFVESVELDALWNLATICVQPSLYEGFGIPILEAFEAGVPVIASRTQALVEVAGDAAIFINPCSPKNFAEKIKLLINNKNLQNDLIKKGKTRLKRFSWGKTASQTYEVYKRI